MKKDKNIYILIMNHHGDTGVVPFASRKEYNAYIEGLKQYDIEIKVCIVYNTSNGDINIYDKGILDD